MALPWLLLPPAILLTASVIHPVYTFRYIVSDQSGPRKGTGERILEGAYPYGLARLRNISAGASPQQSGTLGGTYASASVIRQRLAHITRLWVVEWTIPKPVQILDGLGFRLIHRWDVTGLWLRLYTTRARH